MTLKQIVNQRLLKKAQEREKYLAAMNEILEDAKKNNRSLSTEEDSLFSELEGKCQAIDSELKKHDTNLEKIMAEMDDLEKRYQSSMDPQQKKQDNNVEIRQFMQFIRTGETRDLAAANNGTIIPTSVANQVTDYIYEISPLLQEATIYNVSENLNLPVYDYAYHTTSFLTEFQNIVESSGTFTSIPMKSHIMGTMAKIGKSLLNRTDVQVLPFIISACAKSIARYLELEIIANVNDKFASTLMDVTNGITTATPDVIAPEELIALKNRIPSILLPGSKWLMHKNTLTYLQSLKDADGNFLFGNNLSQDSGNMLLGHEVMLSDNMTLIGTTSRMIYFGNFKEGLAIKIGNQSADVYRELFAREYCIGVGHTIEVDVSATHSSQALAVMIGG